MADLTLRSALRLRQRRGEILGVDLFRDPAWDMLIGLAAEGEGAQLSVKSVLAASGVPDTTALRYLGELVDAGLMAREPSSTDGRVHYVRLTDKAQQRLADWFAQASRVAA